MKTKLMTVITLAFLTFASQLLLAGEEIAVIVNVNNPVTSMSKRDVQVYFLKKTKKKWDNGEKIRPIDLSGNPIEREIFLAKVLEMTPESSERYWIEQQYVKAEKPPKRVDDDGRVIKLVGTFKGGIGFVNKNSLTPEALKKVKTILTIN